MNEAVLVAMGRSAIGKAPKGALRFTRPEDLATDVLRGVLQQLPDLPVEDIDDLILGCAFPEAEQGLNAARIIALKLGLGDHIPGQTLNRFCSSGIQAIAAASNSILAGQNHLVLAGGMESMSTIPLGGNWICPNPALLAQQPHAYDTMGITAENVAKKYHITREMQDDFALHSHQKAFAAEQKGYFAEEIIPVHATSWDQGAAAKRTSLPSESPITKTIVFQKDEGIRPDISPEGLSALPPIFKAGGTVTAGNSSQTSDGAAFVVLMAKEKALQLGYKPLAKLVGYAVVGVPPEIMGIGPIGAIQKVLKNTHLTLQDMDLIELNEAFASQSLACIRELGLPEDKVNVHGGAIALGHPLGCTGAALTVKLLHELRRREGRYGLVSMCVGAGMGVAGIYELL